MSDALCRLATGGGFATRTKYSDDDETIFSATRPIVLNGIDDIAERPDLLDRAIVLNLPRITTDKRRTEQEFWGLFTATAPKILGALLDAVSGGLRHLPGVRPDRMLRMADFTCWGEAIGRGLGWGEGAFLEAFEQNQNSASVAALEACPVASAVRKLMDFQPAWAGTATQLLERLVKFADDTTLRSKDWPKKPNMLSNRLKRSAPTMRREGIEIENGISGKHREIKIMRSNSEKQHESSSTSPPHECGGLQDNDLKGDDRKHSVPGSIVDGYRDGPMPSSSDGADQRSSSMIPSGGSPRKGLSAAGLGDSTGEPANDADGVDDGFQELPDEPGVNGEEEMEWDLS